MSIKTFASGRRGSTHDVAIPPGPDNTDAARPITICPEETGLADEDGAAVRADANSNGDLDGAIAAWLSGPATQRPSDRVDDPPAGLGACSVSVVIPAFNEAENLPHVLPRIPTWVTEVVIVDGLSTDDTIKMARMLLPTALIVLQHGHGKGDALASGFAAAHGDIIVMLDADGSTDPGEIPQFVQALVDGVDFAKGSRCVDRGGSEDISRLRAAGNKGLTGLVNLLYGTHYTDLCYGYNAFWARCLPYMHLDCDGFEVETQMHTRVARAGLRVREVPSVEHKRINGESNLRTFHDGWRVLRVIIKERLARTQSRARGIGSASAPPQPR
jgi:hypothetical protein